LEKTLKMNKEIYLFDEADNNLDENNKNIIKKKLEMISRKKIVIIMTTKWEWENLIYKKNKL
jgi:ABC-type transport system involved in cytochrome bd biosynthesis fused ATPase/permease subunit